MQYLINAHIVKILYGVVMLLLCCGTAENCNHNVAVSIAHIIKWHSHKALAMITQELKKINTPNKNLIVL